MYKKEENGYEKPFVKTFQTPRGYYFYDVNRDMVCSVDCDTYCEINKILESGEPICESEQIRTLKENGYLSSKRTLEIKNAFTENARYLLDHHQQQLTLQVTQACNLCCSYCPYANNPAQEQQRSHSNKMMNIETAKKAIDFFAAHCDQAEEIYIGFYGGEPLISWPLIVEAVSYADKVLAGKVVNYGLTTNATLLTDEMIDYMAEKRFLVQISLDGPKAIHDKHRIRTDGSPTYDVVMQKLEKIITRYGDDSLRLAINMVINPNDPIDEILNWVENPLFSKILVRGANVDVDQIRAHADQFAATDDFIAKINYVNALTWINYLQLVSDIKCTPLYSEVVTSLIDEYSNMQIDEVMLPDVGAPSGPCISGVKKLFVNVDGKLYPCEKVNELSDDMVIGDLDNGIDYKKVQKHLNIAQINPERCRNCWAQLHCDICQKTLGDGDDEFLSGKAENRRCDRARATFMETLRICTMIRESKTIYEPVREV